ncbi:MAG: hypothetical protein IKL36_00445 [Clostridia bacterium]|nr:hypothetical protein [Clostridia bacterium]
MKQRNVLIIGDSYSTFEGYIPCGYEVFYKKGREDNDVSKVEETWWHQVISELGANLVLNNSWSGSTIGYTGYCGSDCSKTNSFIYRFDELIEKGFFKENSIDTVFVFGGTNDDWSGAPLGSPLYSQWKREDLYYVLPAISCFLNKVRETLPDADIYCLINTELKREITECFETSCEKYKIKAVSFDSIEKELGHPTVKGMRDIRDGVMKAIAGKK